MRLGFSSGVVAALLLVVVLDQSKVADGHGRLMEPPSRSSIWRFPEYAEYQPEENWTDNELYCGGFTVQHEQNGGKCGPCGDNYREKRPRANENGGRYGRGIIVRNYRPGQAIKVNVELTQNHKGHFEFSLCELKNGNEMEDEECFEKYPLKMADKSGLKYKLPSYESGWFNTTVVLPANFTSPHAVLRWHYRTANRWSPYNNSTGDVGNTGIGPQETFRGCADISIGDYKPSTPRPPLDGYSTTTTKMPAVSTTTTITTTRRPGTTIITTLPPKPHPTGAPSSSSVKPPSKVPSMPMQHPPKPTSPVDPPSGKPSSTTESPNSIPGAASGPVKPAKHPVMRPPVKDGLEDKHYY